MGGSTGLGFTKGYVYIFKHHRENWVKIGITINDPTQRLRALIKIDPEYYNNDKRLPLATWSVVDFYLTEKYTQVEELAHKYLDKHLVKDAPMGEIFNCSVEQGIKAIEDAMKELGVEPENIVEPKDV